MSATRASTFDRVPMGAADLKARSQQIFKKAMIISVVAHLALVGIYLASKLYSPKDEAAYTGRVIRMETLPPPPPLTDAPPPPVVPLEQQIVKPTIGVPVPVPDAQAPEQTIMTQQELSQAISPVGLGTAGKDSLVIRGDDLPEQGDFVYYEDPPSPVTRVEPKYPDMAREAQITGRVVLHVLVGKDGRVKNIKVIRSVNYLDDAAKTAVQKWVFKPALSNNKPVAVWVEVPVDFHF